MDMDLQAVNNSPNDASTQDGSESLPPSYQEDAESLAPESFMIDLSTQLPQRWYPRITPYRLLVMLTGVGLGTAKAILVSRGQTVAPITLEWIASVVVYLIFQFLESYASDEELPRYVGWLFSLDCVDMLWATLAVFNVPKPAYRSDERVATLTFEPYSRHPPITGYRILVSAVVLIFGMIKMTCGYLGLAAEVGTVDWIFGIVVTTSLYFLGLYQENTVDLIPFLFTTDYSQNISAITSTGSYLLLYALGILISLVWSGFWFKSLYTYVTTPFSLISTEPKTQGDHDLYPTFIDKIHDYSLKIMASSFIALLAFLGIPPLLLLLWPRTRILKVLRIAFWSTFTSVGRSLPSMLEKRVVFKLQDFEALRSTRTFAVNAINFIRFYGKVFAYITAYICTHLLAAAFCADIAIVFAGFTFRFWTTFQAQHGNILVRIVNILVVAIFLVMTVPGVYMMLLVILSLFKPLRVYLRTRHFKRGLAVIY